MERKLWLLGFMMVVMVGTVLAQDGIMVQGNWQGEFSSADWQSRSLRAQVVGESWTDFRCYIYVGTEGDNEIRGLLKGKTDKGITPFQGEIDLGENLGGVYGVEGQIAKGVFSGSLKSKSGGKSAEFSMKRVMLKSPTLGQEPPEGAIVLMMDQGESKEQQQELQAKQAETFEKEWNVEKRWGVNADGAICMSPSSIWTKKEFGDADYHLEFQTPYMPTERDQGRGNSGFYIEGRYEIQVLDSFTDEPRDNQCGGIYQQAVPLCNPSLPPGEWQTYDVSFRTPRFDADGKKTENARLTVKLNGVVIHDNLELRRPTPGGVAGNEATQGVILLQDHNNYVRFNNAWVKPVN